MFRIYKLSKIIFPFNVFSVAPNKLLIALLFLLFQYASVYCQAKHPAELDTKSTNIQTIEGVKYYIHFIEKGQTLSGIAKLYNRKVDDVVIDNPSAINGIKAGAELKIAVEKKITKKIPAVVVKTPVSTATTPINKSEPEKFILHKVEKGQTLYSIAKQYNVSIDNINSNNPEITQGLRTDQIIKIKVSETPPSATHAQLHSLPITNIVVEKKTPTATIDTVSKKTISPVKTDNAKIPETKKTEYKAASPLPKVTTIANVANTSMLAAKLGYPGEKKTEYNIAFFLPFHTKEAIEMGMEKLVRGEDQFSNKTNIALQFYDGALLAIDSLKKQGLNAKIFVYDLDDTDSLSIPITLRKPELAEMDLIIGPLYANSFVPIAKYAKEHSIPIVSPFVQANKILFDNPYVCKATSSNMLQVVQMANFVADTFHHQNIIIVNSGNKKEVELCTTFRKIIRETRINKMYPLGDTARESNGIAGIEALLHPTKVNIIVLPSINQSYVTEFLNAINILQENRKIVVFGLQNWIGFDNLDFEYLNKLSLHVVSNNYINYNNPVTKIFTTKFRATYKTNPDNFAYNGFDITYYFISSLQKYGKGFLNDIANNVYKGISTNMNFIKSTTTKSGYENKYVFVLKYQNYELVPAN